MQWCISTLCTVILKVCKIKLKLRIFFHNIKTSARVWAVTCESIMPKELSLDLRKWRISEDFNSQKPNWIWVVILSSNINTTQNMRSSLQRNISVKFVEAWEICQRRMAWGEGVLQTCCKPQQTTAGCYPAKRNWLILTLAFLGFCKITLPVCKVK